MNYEICDLLDSLSLEDMGEFIEASSDILSKKDVHDIETVFIGAEHLSSLIKELKPNPLADTIVERLLKQKSTAQRTHDWYIQGQRVLTASQFATITKGIRTRGALVLEKAAILRESDINNKALAVYSRDIRPFDWGIRFEPIVKRLYETLTSSKVADLGRLIHQKDPRLAASPDGLLIEGERKSRLVEFKAPITRIITEEIPKDYWMQMQIQMEVADVDLCDYFEAKIISTANMKEYVEPSEETVKGKGVIYLIGDNELQPKKYLYPETSEPPSLEEGELILETIPWACTSYNLKTVERSSEWFSSMKTSIDAFWADVELAKRGEFKLPESTRKRKIDECKIQDDA
jgi:hypothetical protein